MFRMASRNLSLPTGKSPSLGGKNADPRSYSESSALPSSQVQRLQIPAGYVIIYGGKGELGSFCVSYFKSKNWWVGSIDFQENDEADDNIILESKTFWVEEEAIVLRSVANTFNDMKIDALICTAERWIRGNAESADLVQSCDLTWKRCVWPSVITVKLASMYLKDGGLVVFSGAQTALAESPEVIGYGMAKAAIHHLVKSLSAEGSGMPYGSLVLAILPLKLDTPINRKHARKSDISSMTSLQFVANLIYTWATGQEHPDNGSLVVMTTTKGETKLAYH